MNKMIARVIYNNVENGKILGIPVFFHDGTSTYTTSQENYHYILHNTVVTTTTSNGYPA